MTDAACQAIARHVVLDEAELLDQQRWDEWLALLDQRMHYWVPLDPAAGGPEEAPSIFDEDKILLEMRCRRFRHARAVGRESGRSTLHQVSGIRAIWEEEEIVVRSQLVVYEYAEERMTLYPGHQTHRLVARASSWKIASKQVRLIHMTGVFDPIDIIL